MATLTKYGLADHNRAISYDDFMAGDFEEGYRYELIDGRLYVSPMPNPPENVLEEWLGEWLRSYRRANPDVINFVSGKTRVFVRGRRRTTCPEPDIAVFDDFPLHHPLGEVRWQDLSPMLVVEVMTADAWKDLIRNVELYLQVPSIREYWIIDAREDPDEPTLIQHRRRGGKWVVREFPYGATFTTKLLPGFTLVIDPRRQP